LHVGQPEPAGRLVRLALDLKALRAAAIHAQDAKLFGVDLVDARQHALALEQHAVAADLLSADALAAEWLYADHGADELAWSDHCNRPWTRWILREHGITLVGPCASEIVAEMPDHLLREQARAGLSTLTDDVLGWCPPDIAWCQRYLVVQAARSLYTVRTAQVASKRDALRWAMMHGDPRWRPLLQQVQGDRDRGFDPRDLPRPGSLDAAREFAAYAAAVA